MEFIVDFVMKLITGETALVGYILGIGFSVIGFILFFSVNQTDQFIGALCIALVGLIILFFRIRKDVIEIRGDIKGK
ncbi:MAG: hypothetical protein HYZ43_07335 [Flavobacteriia bacterium]|nr:hypothetical protein [Flavobacteriia bacterium]